MKTLKVNFENSLGQELSARLELPLDSHPHNFAVFAHCFTCTKNLTAIRNIVQALTMKGIAVLRFDFAGLGESEGEFADSNFSGNVQDLVSAATFLTQHYQAPSILIGHSLGGAAVLYARQLIPSVKAVATIGAPYEPAHIHHLLVSGLDEIQTKGEAEVNIGGRNFTIKKQFLEDIQSLQSLPIIQNLNASLLVLHSPQDETVEIDNATQIYKAARQPRSFVSLDGANHLLTDKKDSLYVGEVIATWASRYVEIPEEEALFTDEKVVTRTENDSFTTDIKAGKHAMTADEPENVGGNDFGPTPYDFLIAALGACTGMTLQMYAKRKGWDVQEVKVHLNHDKIYAQDCEDCDKNTSKVDKIERFIEIEGQLDESQLQKLLEIADKCPVHRTLHSEILIQTTLKKE